MKLHHPVRLLGLLLSLVQAIFAAEETVPLPVFRVEGTPWQYAKTGDIEIITRASKERSRAVVAALLRGQKVFPDFCFDGVNLPLKIILVDEPERVIGGLTRLQERQASEHDWGQGFVAFQGANHAVADKEKQVLACNLAGIQPIWEILSARATGLLLAQSPPFPQWALFGLVGSCGTFRSVIGRRGTGSVQIPKLTWPDDRVEPGIYPDAATEFSAFSVMFDPSPDLTAMTHEAGRQYAFQTGLFSRWSLFGPAKNGRNRNGYWALAEIARRVPVTEALFKECIGVDYATACAEMRAYLKSKAVGIQEIRMAQSLAIFPEAEQLEFRMATPAETDRILKDFTQLVPLK